MLSKIVSLELRISTIELSLCNRTVSQYITTKILLRVVQSVVRFKANYDKILNLSSAKRNGILPLVYQCYI